jgi:hypothetical protein
MSSIEILLPPEKREVRTCGARLNRVGSNTADAAENGKEKLAEICATKAASPSAVPVDPLSLK